MANPHGTPIWYELVAADPDAAKLFYEAVLDWRIEDRPPGPMDYRMIAAAAEDNVGGLAAIGPDTPVSAANPGWRFYIGVDDVDATAVAIERAGGAIGIAPFDLPGVGRMALAEDPQGLPFFIMRGEIDAESRTFDASALGKCGWNELVTPDQAVGNAFYAAVFGWTYPDSMTMPGDMGDYVFVHCAGRLIGGTMTAQSYGGPPAWRFYFRAADIEAAARTIRDGGGTVHMGPVDVPGGDRVIIASDPAGSAFGVVAAAAGS